MTRLVHLAPGTSGRLLLLLLETTIWGTCGGAGSVGSVRATRPLFHQVALETLLPELGEPGVARVVVWVQLEIVVVEVVHVGRVDAHRNAAQRHFLLALNHVEPVGPAVALFWYLFSYLFWYLFSYLFSNLISFFVFLLLFSSSCRGAAKSYTAINAADAHSMHKIALAMVISSRELASNFLETKVSRKSSAQSFSQTEIPHESFAQAQASLPLPLPFCFFFCSRKKRVFKSKIAKQLETQKTTAERERERV